ncbi:hypothetical protein Naga_100490g5 [Nannochloropsis gaditana]|uniref:Uncharacterized protein n=1 Tax=Nannochloropsis gaditana TaxID=72520 RepID=W7TXT2_9STRA|nr:hypothetical protein Naga_100490g5 [Nannochloropsis gaditana]
MHHYCVFLVLDVIYSLLRREKEKEEMLGDVIPVGSIAAGDKVIILEYCIASDQLRAVDARLPLFQMERKSLLDNRGSQRSWRPPVCMGGERGQSRLTTSPTFVF